MATLLQRASTDSPARANAIQPEFLAGVEVPVVTVCPATPGAVVLAVRGEVDSCTSSLLRNLLLENLRPGCPQLVADLTEVSFLGAAGLTVLVAARGAAEAAGIKLCLVAGTRVVLRPLMITGLDAVFDICPDIAHARTHLGDIAVQIIDGSLDDDGLQAGPRAGPVLRPRRDKCTVWTKPATGVQTPLPDRGAAWPPAGGGPLWIVQSDS